MRGYNSVRYLAVSLPTNHSTWESYARKVCIRVNVMSES